MERNGMKQSTCTNCGGTQVDRYCNFCGQSSRSTEASLWALLKEVFDEVIGIDSRIRRTLLPFFFKPGQLALDYIRGRRKKYSSPLRLYVFMSMISLFSIQARNYAVDSQRVRASENAKQSEKNRSDTAEEGESNDALGSIFLMLEKLPERYEWLLSETLLERSRQQLGSLRALSREERLAKTDQAFFDIASLATLMLIPISASLLKLLLFRSRLFDHLIFSSYFFSLLLFLSTVLNIGIALNFTTNHQAVVVVAVMLLSALTIVVGIWHIVSGIHRVYPGSRWLSLLRASAFCGLFYLVGNIYYELTWLLALVLI